MPLHCTSKLLQLLQRTVCYVNRKISESLTINHSSIKGDSIYLVSDSLPVLCNLIELIRTLRHSETIRCQIADESAKNAIKKPFKEPRCKLSYVTIKRNCKILSIMKQSHSKTYLKDQ